MHAVEQIRKSRSEFPEGSGVGDFFIDAANPNAPRKRILYKRADCDEYWEKIDFRQGLDRHRKNITGVNGILGDCFKEYASKRAFQSLNGNITREILEVPRVLLIESTKFIITRMTPSRLGLWALLKRGYGRTVAASKCRHTQFQILEANCMFSRDEIVNQLRQQAFWKDFQKSAEWRSKRTVGRVGRRCRRKTKMKVGRR